MTEVVARLPPDLERAVAHHRARLGDFARHVHYYLEAGSTNDLAASLAVEGAPQGTVVVAAAQTAGRGRWGRQWHSPPGSGLYFSVVFRPRDRRSGSDDGGSVLAAPQVALLTLMAGVAVADGVAESTGLELTLKWPNDLVVETERPTGGSTWRKVGGVLAEASVAGTRLQHVIVGIGINVKGGVYPPEIRDRATSLEAEIGRDVDAAAVFAGCLAALAEGARDLDGGRERLVLDRWRRRAPSAVGRRVAWDGPRGSQRGVTRGIDDTGALLVEHAGGVDRVVAGEVSWL